MFIYVNEALNVLPLLYIVQKINLKRPIAMGVNMYSHCRFTSTSDSFDHQSDAFPPSKTKCGRSVTQFSGMISVICRVVSERPAAVWSVVPGAKFLGRTPAILLAGRNRNYEVTAEVLNLLQFVPTILHFLRPEIQFVIYTSHSVAPRTLPSLLPQPPPLPPPAPLSVISPLTFPTETKTKLPSRLWSWLRSSAMLRCDLRSSAMLRAV
jgi:hypothetical protein